MNPGVFCSPEGPPRVSTTDACSLSWSQGRLQFTALRKLPAISQGEGIHAGITGVGVLWCVEGEQGMSRFSFLGSGLGVRPRGVLESCFFALTWTGFRATSRTSHHGTFVFNATTAVPDPGRGSRVPAETLEILGKQLKQTRTRDSLCRGRDLSKM